MAKTQTTRMNLPLDLMVAAKALEGRFYHSEKDNRTMRIDEIHRSLYATVTSVFYHPKGDYATVELIHFRNFRESYHPATSTQAKAFNEVLKSNQRKKF